MVARTKLTVAYLGSGFSGWQRQDRARTVQGDLEKSLAKLAETGRIPVVGAGRTDAGVHAVAQAAHIDLPMGFRHRSCRGFSTPGSNPISGFVRRRS